MFLKLCAAFSSVIEFSWYAFWYITFNLHAWFNQYGRGRRADPGQNCTNDHYQFESIHKSQFDIC